MTNLLRNARHQVSMEMNKVGLGGTGMVSPNLEHESASRLG